jgi:hypothetical protein
MSEPDAESDEPTHTTPTGATIPAPEGDDVVEALRKVAHAAPVHEAVGDDDASTE